MARAGTGWDGSVSFNASSASSVVSPTTAGDRLIPAPAPPPSVVARRA